MGAEKKNDIGVINKVPLPLWEGNQKPDSWKLREMGAKSKDIKERLKVAKRNHDASVE